MRRNTASCDASRNARHIRNRRLIGPLACLLFGGCAGGPPPWPGGPSGLTANAWAIQDLRAQPDPADTRQMFRFVFSRLPRRAKVVPTENLYYFQFWAAGTHFQGSISLFAHMRDQGTLTFGYTEYFDKQRQAVRPLKGGGGDLNWRDGVRIEKLEGLRYRVSFEQHSVVFELNPTPLTPPRRARLRASESYVASSWDESGLKFHLIYDKDIPRLFWILDEDEPAPERFERFGEDMLIGARTEFVFYDDRDHDRKVLVGVEGVNVLANNWYDGPFDQLPDNAVYDGRIDLKPYLEATYPDSKGRIDAYGHYLNDPHARIPVASCRVYFSIDELDFVSRAARERRDGKITESDFYDLITRQHFDVPERYRRKPTP